MVYQIFASSQKEFDRTVEELKRHHNCPQDIDKRFLIFGQDTMYCSALIEKLEKTLKQNGTYKNQLTFVLAPKAEESETVKSSEYQRMMELYKKNMVEGKDFFVLTISEFIRTEEEIEQEELDKRKDIEDWFTNTLRNATNT